MTRARIDWTIGDGARAVGVWEAMKQGRTVWRARDAFRGLLEVMSHAENLRQIATGEVQQGVAISSINGATDEELDALPEEVATAYRATRRAASSLFYTSRRVIASSPTIELPTEPAVAPVIVVALTVVGIAAVAATAWFAVEAEEQKVELRKHEVSTLAQVDLYLKDLAQRIAAGAPLPKPPQLIETLGTAEESSGALLLATGLLLGGAGAAGLAYVMRNRGRSSSSPAAVENPRPARRMLRRRARPRLQNSHNPARARAGASVRSKENPEGPLFIVIEAPGNYGDYTQVFSSHRTMAAAQRAIGRSTRYVAVADPQRRTKGTRIHRLDAMRLQARGNPRRPKAGVKIRERNAKGYSKKTVGKNIAKERRSGTPAPQAVAMSLRSARTAYRKAHPKGPYPAHLKPPGRAKKASAGRRAGKTRRNAKSARRRGETFAKKRTGRVAPKPKRKLNAKKRSPKRALNARRPRRVSKKTVARRAKRSVKRRGNASRPRKKSAARRALTMRGRRAKRRRNAGSTATPRRSRTSSRKRTSRRA